MPLGRRALDQTTPYLVYEFRYNGNVFYVGVAHGHIRHAKRWSHVANLVRHESAGTLKPSKAKNLNQKSNQVIAALIRAGCSAHEVTVAWRGNGKQAAEMEEKRCIRQLVDDGCLLANMHHNVRNSVTVDQIVQYLDLKTT